MNEVMVAELNPDGVLTLAVSFAIVFFVLQLIMIASLSGIRYWLKKIAERLKG